MLPSGGDSVIYSSKKTLNDEIGCKLTKGGKLLKKGNIEHNSGCLHCKVGNTQYEINVYSSENAKESIESILMHLIVSDKDKDSSNLGGC